MVSAIRAAAAATAIALAAACGTAPAGNEFTKADIESIRQMTQQFSQAVSERNVERVLAHYPETIVFMPPNSGTMRGKEWVKGYWDSRFKDGEMTMTLESRDIAGHGPMAYESGTYTTIVRNESGEEWRDRGKYLFVLRKGNGHWRYEYAIWNSDLPRPIVNASTD